MTLVRVNLPVGGTTVAAGVTTATVPVPVLKAAAAAVATTRAEPVPVTTSQPLQTATASQNAPQVGIVSAVPSVPDSTVTLLGDDVPLPELGSTVGSTLRNLTMEDSSKGRHFSGGSTTLGSHLTAEAEEGLDALSSTLGMQRPTIVSVVSTESAAGQEVLQSRLNTTQTSMTTFQPIDPPSQVRKSSCMY